ncbi:DUF3152 domain-containing protein [Terrabacter aeriphilus]|uniref:DUF3152 domain-containing protein n=2 Tax=Terrabacter aeriphilus TaxID=515662 RepID=A0ABP9JCK7_9MICO
MERMVRGSAVARPPQTSWTAVRRRRVAAGAAVVLCVVVDVWAVTWAGAREATEPGPFARSGRLALGVGTGPAASLAEVERVPDAATDSQVGAGSSAGTSPQKATSTSGTGDGRDAKGAVVEAGDGRFTVVPMPASALRPAPTSGRTVRYTVEVEGGVDVRPAEFASTVGTVLTDPRGWQARDGVRFVDVSPAAAAAGAAVDLRITLASPRTTDKLCAPLETRGQVSCHNSGRVVLNLRRWVLGAEAYGSDVAGYRTYLVNHEVGHGIGHAHAYCGGPGKVAPVMMQQTYGLKGCTAWPWPTPKPA